MNNANYSWFESESQASLAAQLADDIVTQLDVSIQARGRAILALSGGSTPKPLFKELCQRSVDWSKVIVTLVDERWVDENHELSNAAFLKQYLINELGPNSSRAQFIPLYVDAADAQSSLADALAQYAQLTNSSVNNPAKFDVVVLGMGGDGHTASFFPDAENIELMIDLDAEQHLFSCESPTTQVSRVTWSLAMLIEARFLALHFTGGEKKAIFERATRVMRQADLPISSAIMQEVSPLQVYYAE